MEQLKKYEPHHEKNLIFDSKADQGLCFLFMNSTISFLLNSKVQPSHKPSSLTVTNRPVCVNDKLFPLGVEQLKYDLY